MIPILKYGEVSPEEIFARAVPEVDVAAIVSDIITQVKSKGDKALFALCEKFDKAKLSCLQVSQAEIEEAVAATPKEFMEILEEAAENIRAFHAMQMRQGFEIRKDDGCVLGQRITPVDRAGLYVPGGTAAYPSTVLMDAIPAKIAGCGEVVMVTPPNREGKIAPVILAAAKVAGVDKIFKVGGAQAIAALAYGTESIPKVDVIVGPGNAFVAEAKKQVYGKVAIDMIAGPSEILIVADGASDPSVVAADMLASAVLVTDSESLALAVQAELEKQIPQLSRQEIARASIDNNGKIIIADSIHKAIEISNAIAPEHLELCVDKPFDYLDAVRHAGSVFLGRDCPEALGDYFAGPNHTLPTSGTAKFSSPLGVDSFLKKTQYSYYPRQALDKVADKVAYFANAEGLTGHAKSALSRKETEK